jgi:hypothetical protein
MKKPLSGPSHRNPRKQAHQKPVALTVKIDGETYVRLSMLRARERLTAQEILTQALNAYLDRAGA